MRTIRATAALLVLAGCKPAFPPHPGTILWRDGSHSRVESAASVPDDIKFIYFGRDGQQTEGRPGAVRRVPVTEIDKIDIPGSTQVEIIQYGPNHAFLKSTAASTGP